MKNLSGRTAHFTDSVIRRMTRISNQYGAVNLSQGFPDFEPPKEILDRLAEVSHEDYHQYSITWGAQNFREALARKQSKLMGRTIDPNGEIVVTCGSTEAMMAAMMTVADPGDKVIIFSPFYENYGADNVTWESASIQDIIDMPSKITDFSPKQISNLASRNGWTVEPLGKGRLAGIPYEQGGGISMHAPNGSSIYIQYHPGSGHHGVMPYYKISSGKNGIVNVEREVELSGSTHSKGVLILSGYLGEMFAQDIPLCLTASICFEQLYNGVDGDSGLEYNLHTHRQHGTDDQDVAYIPLRPESGRRPRPRRCLPCPPVR